MINSRHFLLAIFVFLAQMFIFSHLLEFFLIFSDHFFFFYFINSLGSQWKHVVNTHSCYSCFLLFPVIIYADVVVSEHY